MANKNKIRAEYFNILSQSDKSEIILNSLIDCKADSDNDYEYYQKLLNVKSLENFNETIDQYLSSAISNELSLNETYELYFALGPESIENFIGNTYVIYNNPKEYIRTYFPQGIFDGSEEMQTLHEYIAENYKSFSKYVDETVIKLKSGTVVHIMPY